VIGKKSGSGGGVTGMGGDQEGEKVGEAVPIAEESAGSGSAAE
jgi:hypothetical protein